MHTPTDNYLPTEERQQLLSIHKEVHFVLWGGKGAELKAVDGTLQKHNKTVHTLTLLDL